MLHDAWDDHGVAVGDRVDLDLDSLEVLVDQDLTARHRTYRPDHVAPQFLAVADDLHRATAQHVGRAYEHRVAGSRGNRLGLFDGGRGATHGLRDADRVERARKRTAIFGEVDRLDARAHDRDTALVEGIGQIDRGLPTKLDESAADALSARHVQRAIKIERLEVQAVRGVEVGRDCLGVGVHHDGTHARLA